MTDVTKTPAQVLDQICTRLQTVAEARPFRFRDTSRDAARAHLIRRTTFRGCKLTSTLQAEDRLQARLPKALTHFYTRLGEARGEFLMGSDVAWIFALAAFGAEADKLFRESGGAGLPERAITFLFHQGYTAHFVIGSPIGEPRIDDAPVLAVTEGSPEIRQVAPSLLAYFEASLRELEELNEIQLRQGGYYLTLRDGRATQSFPALASGERPVDTEDVFVD